MNYKEEEEKRQNNELHAYNLDHLSDSDLLFLIESYVTKRCDYEHIASQIKGDADIITQMVDNDRVFERVIREGNKIFHVSPYFLFTLLIRRVFKLKKEDEDFINDVVAELNSSAPAYPWNKSKIVKLLNSIDVSNYLANMLAVFLRTSRFYQIQKYDEKQYQYIIDMIEEIRYSDTIRKFYIYCHIGNYALFFTGMFPEYIGHKFRYKKTFIDSRYYVDFGKTYFCLASEHDMARQHELDDTLRSLSEGFEIIIKLLHHMRNEYLPSNNLKL